MGIYFKYFLAITLMWHSILAPMGYAENSGNRCRATVIEFEKIKAWPTKVQKVFREQQAKLKAWSHLRIGWFKTLDKVETDRHRDDYLRRFSELFPEGRSSTGSDAVGSRIEISPLSTVEQKLGFFEAVGTHFISRSEANPLRSENILDTRVRDFFKKRRFFKKLKNLDVSKLKFSQMEDLFLDLYTLKNPGVDGLPARIRALIAALLPLKGDFYEAWYRDAVLKRFYLEVLSAGLIPAMAKLNMPIKESLFGDSHTKNILSQITGVGIAAALNWYVLIPMAYMLGYLHLPDVNLAEWANISKALQVEIKHNPELIDEIISSGFRHELVEAWIEKYGIKKVGAAAKFDLIYRTIRSLYLGMLAPPAIYFFATQFGLFDMPQIAEFMSQWMNLRFELIPFLLPEQGGTSALEDLVRPDEF